MVDHAEAWEGWAKELRPAPDSFLSMHGRRTSMIQAPVLSSNGQKLSLSQNCLSTPYMVCTAVLVEF